MTRETAIGILDMSKHMATSGRLYNEAIDMAIEALHREEAEENGWCHRIKPKEYLPSERTGEWILECDSEGEGDNLYRCSECGCEYGCQEYDKPNFCPNCGAYMRGERKRGEDE